MRGTPMSRETNPFTDPRDANLAAAWEYGRPIGKRREYILTALIVAVIIMVTAAWWFA